jgi:hypothetical protein
VTRTISLAILLAACSSSDKETPAAAPPAPPATVAPADAAPATPRAGDRAAADDSALPPFLRADVADTHDRRAYVARCGSAAFRRDALSEKSGRCDFKGELGEVVALEQQGDAVRIVHKQYGVRSALWVRAADLAERPTGPTPLALTEKATGDSGVQLLGGAPVAVTSRNEQRLAVAVSEEGVTVRGFVPPSAMGVVYQRPPPVGEPSGLLERAVDVRSAEGTVVARVAANASATVRIVGDADGEREIEVATRHLRVRGRVDAGAVTPTAPLGSGGILGHGPGPGWGGLKIVWLALPINTPLTAQPNGEPVAVIADDDQRVAMANVRRDGWLKIEYRTAWGSTSAWVDCPAVERPKPKAALRCTTAGAPDKVEPLPSR